MSNKPGIAEFCELIDAYQCAQKDGSHDVRAKARIALMDAYRTALSHPASEPKAPAVEEDAANGAMELRIDSGAALKVAERFGFPMNENMLNFARAIVKRADGLQARAPSPKAPAVEAGALDPDAVTRLKGLCRMLGLENAIPEELYGADEGPFVIFGQMRFRIEKLTAPPAASAQKGLTDASLRTLVYQLAVIDTSFESEIKNGIQMIRDVLRESEGT